MATNLYAALRRLLPEAPVIIGRVVAHHPEDDTSSIILPSDEASVPVDTALSVGATFRARGRTVAVGQRAFVRAGVVESQAPEGDVVEQVIGDDVAWRPLAYVGPDTAPALQVGVLAAVNWAPRWADGVAPLRFTVVAGALPPGLALDPFTGVLAGTPATAGSYAGLVVRATDASAAPVDAPAMTLTVTA